jgi:aryl-alcohol dehydrogenase-like predicted oxidoreductase
MLGIRGRIGNQSARRDAEVARMGVPMHGIIAPTTLDVVASQSIRVGFGCGGLMGGRHRAASLRSLGAAIDCGITYFDTARMYGWGTAEGLLGELTPRIRDSIVIVSKAGILPSSRSLRLRALGRGVREICKAVPSLKAHLQLPRALSPRFGMFKPAELRASIETSLRELKTDYLDILLLHEVGLADLDDPEVLALLRNLQSEGKVREFGTATGIEETLKIAETRPAFSGVMQIPSSIWDANVARLPARPGSLIVTHSCFGKALHELVDRLSTDRAFAQRWTSELQIKSADTAAAARLLLAHALHANSTGIVLFSSLDPSNIAANVRTAQDGPQLTAQLERLQKVVSQGPA